MANGLLLVLELINPGKHAETAQALVKALTPAGAVNILHYAYAVPIDLKDGKARLLLSTIYDEDFDAYIADIVHALPGAFDAAAANIVGMNTLIPIAGHIKQFTAFVLANDLTNGGKAYVNGAPGFFAAYPWTVNQVLARMPPPAKAAASKAKKKA